MTTATDTFHPPAPEDFEGAEVVTLQDAIMSILTTTGLVLAVTACAARGIWLLVKRRARNGQHP